MIETPQAFDQRKRRLFLWLTAPILICTAVFTGSAWGDDSVPSEVMEIIGLIGIFACIVGRCWAILYIGDKKNAALVTQGPYLYTRNPLYFFSAIGLASFGFLMSSGSLAALFFAMVYFSFRYVARKEAIFLAKTFGKSYEGYCLNTPEFFPDLQRFSTASLDNDQLTISTKALKKTLVDGCAFLLLIPLAEYILEMQEQGNITTFFSWY